MLIDAPVRVLPTQRLDQPRVPAGMDQAEAPSVDEQRQLIEPLQEIVPVTWVLGELGQIDEPLLKIAIELERIALSDEYFIERKLYPNVDFYSGIIYRAMGIPSKMFTVLFAVARIAGWIAQWKEMMDDPKNKIARPRQLFTGPEPREFLPLKKR